MIIVGYSGSRFSNWRIADKDKVITGFTTPGINPLQNDERYILNLLNKNNNFINYAEKIKRIYFFGPGIISPEQQSFMVNILSLFFKNAKVYAYLDMKATAIVTCQDKEGLIGIIGSGSNVGYYTGSKLKVNNYGLGYILGDEGSGTWIGRKLLKDSMLGIMPDGIQKKFVTKYPLDRKQIMDRVYRQENVGLFLSSFADFAEENKKNPYILKLIETGFNQLFEQVLTPLKKKHPGLTTHFTGSVAAEFEDILRKVAESYEMPVGEIMREPIQELLNYYINKNK